MDKKATVDKACRLITEAGKNGAQLVVLPEADLSISSGSKWNKDVAGHYARPDAFHLIFDKTPDPILSIQNKMQDLKVTDDNDDKLSFGDSLKIKE